jgi:hypothetical protein
MSESTNNASWTITGITYSTTSATTTDHVIYTTVDSNIYETTISRTWPWYQPPNTTIPWNPPMINTPSPYVYPNTPNIYPNPNITYPTIEITPTLFPAGQWWPILNDAIGILYIEDGKLKLRTAKGEDFVIVDLKDQDEDVVVNLMAIIAKKKLEETAEKSRVGAV